MRLDELTGYHKYEQHTFSEFVSTILKDQGYKLAKGAFAFVLIPPGKDYVYKCWVSDKGYEHFMKIVQENQGNPFLPKLLSKIHKVPIFFKRPETIDGHVNVVKMEKLEPLRNGGGDFVRMADAFMRWEDLTKERVLAAVKKKISDPNKAKGGAQKALHRFAKRKIGRNTYNNETKYYNAEARAITLANRLWERFDIPKFLDAIVPIRNIRDSTRELVIDLHDANVMMRGNQYVITDPFVVDGWGEKEIRIKHLNPEVAHDLPRGLQTDKTKSGRSSSRKSNSSQSSQ